MTARTFTVVEEIGWLALAALSAAQDGRVVATFTRCFYIRTTLDAWVCVSQNVLGSGPLNVRCRESISTSAGWPVQGAAVRFEEGRFFVEGAGQFVHVQARRWTPPVPPAWTRSSLRRGVSALDSLAKPPAEGLGRLGFDRAGRSGCSLAERLALEAAHPFDRTVMDLLNNKASNLDSVERLLGLGPGLTPSGDDYLAGAMVALDLLGETRVRDTIWNTIRQRAPTVTLALSYAYLKAAAAGAVSNALHLLLCSVLSNEPARLPAQLAAVDAIGHTSGWDALAGALRVFRLWLEIRGDAVRCCKPPGAIAAW